MTPRTRRALLLFQCLLKLTVWRLRAALGPPPWRALSRPGNAAIQTRYMSGFRLFRHEQHFPQDPDAAGQPRLTLTHGRRWSFEKCNLWYVNRASIHPLLSPPVSDTRGEGPLRKCNRSTDLTTPHGSESTTVLAGPAKSEVDRGSAA
jgi:hypothetical protein